MPDNSQYLSVSDLSKYIKNTVEGDFGRIYIRGEISGLKKIEENRHVYFSLKDSYSSINVIIWKSSVSRILADVSGNADVFKDGTEVFAEGTLSVYDKTTSLSIVISKMVPVGIGQEAIKFEMLKQKLASEGLFDPERKKTLPEFPQTIGIVSGISAAGKGDMVKILGNRSPFIRIVFFPALVQGKDAPESIVKAIDCASKHFINNTKYKPDILIIGRGGGSIEDMWCFNDENVARAIVACPIPTVTAIGHEQDTFIADFVADVRASTPSNAAEIVTSHTVNLFDTVNANRMRLQGKIRNILENYIYRYQRCDEQRLSGLMKRKYDGVLSDFNYTDGRFSLLSKKIPENCRNRFAVVAAKLDNLSPLKILSRGYSIVQNSEGHSITDESQVTSGENIDIILNNGRIKAIVK